MERLGTITRRVLAGLRDRMEKAGGTAGEAAPPLLRAQREGTARRRKESRRKRPRCEIDEARHAE